MTITALASRSCWVLGSEGFVGGPQPGPVPQPVLIRSSLVDGLLVLHVQLGVCWGSPNCTPPLMPNSFLQFGHLGFWRISFPSPLVQAYLMNKLSQNITQRNVTHLPCIHCHAAIITFHARILFPSGSKNRTDGKESEGKGREGDNRKPRQ